MAGRAGRKRKSGPRHRSGALKKKKKTRDEQVQLGRRMPHRRALRSDDRLDVRAESPLGRLVLAGRVSEEQCIAGELYARAVGAYRATIDSPRSTAGSGRGSGCRSEAFGQENACRVDPDGCRCLRRREAYDSAFCSLNDAGQRAAKVVARVAVHGEAIAPEDVVYLVRGLSSLAAHFGLTGRRRRPQSRNAH